MQEETIHSKHNFAFWFHLVITILAWVGPFFFSWYLMLIAYAVVIIQFMVFDRCLLNAKHGLDTESDQNTTFYSYLLESLGYHPNRKKMKHVVRRYLYVALAALTLVWQLILDFQPLLF